MKQYEVNRAYGAISRLAKMELPLRAAYDIYMLLRKLEPCYFFELEQEKKLLEKYNGSVNKNGYLEFDTNADAEGFHREVDELNKLDIDLDFDTVILSCATMNDIRISPTDIASLEGFVCFEQ